MSARFVTIPLEDGNFRIMPDPDDPARPHGILIKHNYWIWPDRDLAGNTIDFFVQVEGKTFHQAMQIILPFVALAKKGHAHSCYDTSEREIPEDCGIVAQTVR